MPKTPKPGSISATDFLATVSRYAAFTSSPAQAERQTTEPRIASESAGRPSLESLQELDAWRNFTLPATIEARRKEGRAYLSHNELVNLMKCKMKRGKFRPQLLPLVTSNDAAMVEKVTAEAFEYNKDWKADEKPDLGNVKSALGYLSKNLKGVGPATASYLLAAQMPSWIPAFSDEGFRWVFFDKHMPGVIEGTASSTDGWQRPIKYSLKEYFAYVEEVWGISDRLIADYNRDDEQESKNVKSARELFGAGSVEMVGWVFGKESAGWQPRKPEQIGNGTQMSKAADTKHDEPENVSHGKRKNRRGSEKQENLGVDPQNPEVDQDQDSKEPGEAKRRKSKKKEDGGSASKPKAKGRGASSSQASNSGGLRRSSRIHKTANGH